MKLFRMILISVLVFLTAVWAIGNYLGPDDLQSCKDTPDDTTQCKTADAIVALSGGDTQARAAEAITLYQRGWAPILIFSGAAADKSGPSNAEVMREQALHAGVPESAIIIEATSENTSQNAAQTSDIFTSRDITSAILVTSAYHQRRASLEFAHRAPSVALRNHPVTSDNQWNATWWWLTPTGWLLAVPELIGSFVVSVSGGASA